jgi:hypothetical protein
MPPPLRLLLRLLASAVIELRVVTVDQLIHLQVFDERTPSTAVFK